MKASLASSIKGRKSAPPGVTKLLQLSRTGSLDWRQNYSGNVRRCDFWCCKVLLRKRHSCQVACPADLNHVAAKYCYDHDTVTRSVCLADLSHVAAKYCYDNDTVTRSVCLVGFSHVAAKYCYDHDTVTRSVCPADLSHVAAKYCYDNDTVTRSVCLVGLSHVAAN